MRKGRCARWKDNRHENKYIIDGYRMKLLSARLASALKADAHSDGDSRYHIRSLYFDDYDNSCYYENEGGVEPREKYRIRYYERRYIDGCALKRKSREWE